MNEGLRKKKENLPDDESNIWVEDGHQHRHCQETSVKQKHLPKPVLI